MPRAWKPSGHIKAFLRSRLEESATAQARNWQRPGDKREKDAKYSRDAQRRPVSISIHRQRIMQYLWKSNNDLEQSFQESKIMLSWLQEYMFTIKPRLNLHEQEAFMNRLLKRLIDKDEPLAYILESTPFGPLSIVCKQPVLIPRPETEQLTEHVSQLIIDASACNNNKAQQQELGVLSTPSSSLPTNSSHEKKALRILDLCTGSGCIALLLAHRLRAEKVSARIVAVDKSEDALQLAKLNKRKHGVQIKKAHKGAKVVTNGSTTSEQLEDNKVDSASGVGCNSNISSDAMAGVKIQQVDVFDEEQMKRLIEQEGPFDLIISNPPYITRTEYNALDDSVRRFESVDALVGDLVGDEGGLAFYKRIARLVRPESSPRLLAEEGERRTSKDVPSVVVEVGHTQADKVKSLFAATGLFTDISIWKDAWNVQRGVIAWSKGQRCERRIG